MEKNKKKNQSKEKNDFDNTVQSLTVEVSDQPVGISTISSNSSVIDYWNGMLRSDYGSIDLRETVEEILKTEKYKKDNEDLIRVVSELVMERLDQLLDKDTDEIVRILIENKLFKDESTGLKKKITELEDFIKSQQEQIRQLETRLSIVESDNKTFSSPFSPYLPHASWKDVIGGFGDVVENTSSISTSTSSFSESDSSLDKDNEEYSTGKHQGFIAECVNKFRLKKDSDKNTPKAL